MAEPDWAASWARAAIGQARQTRVVISDKRAARFSSEAAGTVKTFSRLRRGGSGFAPFT